MKKTISLLSIFLLFLKMGSVTFGGGVTMAPLLMKEVVEKRQWINEEELTASFALSQSLPGVVAINVSVFIGHRIRGIRGAMIAAVASAMPAIVGIIAFVALLDMLPIEKALLYGLQGVKSASVALIICTAVKMGRTVVSEKLDWVLLGGALVAAIFFQVNGILLVCSFAALGLLCYGYQRWKRGKHV